MSIKITTRNLFDINKAIPGYLSTNGEIVTTGTSYLGNEGTIILPVSKGQKYIVTAQHEHTDWQDWRAWGFVSSDIINDQDLIGGRNGGKIDSHEGYSLIIIVPNDDNIKYLVFSSRCMFDVPNSIFQLEEGTEATPYIPHTIEVDRIVQNLIEITEIIQKTRNLTDTVVGERFSSATGNILKAANAVRTDLVPLEANKPYTVSGLDSGSSFIEILDSNKQPIARTGAKAWGTFTFEWDYTHFITLFKSEISDVGYIAACNYNLTDPNSVKLQIEAGTEATEYIPPMVKLFKAE